MREDWNSNHACCGIEEIGQEKTRKRVKEEEKRNEKEKKREKEHIGMRDAVVVVKTLPIR